MEEFFKVDFIDAIEFYHNGGSVFCIYENITYNYNNNESNRVKFSNGYGYILEDDSSECAISTNEILFGEWYVLNEE